MMVFGVTASVFYPEQYSFGEEDYADFDAEEMESGDDEDKSIVDKIVDGIGGVFTGIGNFLGFLWACLSFNVPFIPAFVRVVLTVPLHVGMVYVIMVSVVRGSGT